MTLVSGSYLGAYNRIAKTGCEKQLRVPDSLEAAAYDGHRYGAKGPSSGSGTGYWLLKNGIKDEHTSTI
jgi:hypothetical protein